MAQQRIQHRFPQEVDRARFRGRRTLGTLSNRKQRRSSGLLGCLSEDSRHVAVYCGRVAFVLLRLVNEQWIKSRCPASRMGSLDRLQLLKLAQDTRNLMLGLAKPIC